jgi:hypothetical protein
MSLITFPPADRKAVRRDTNAIDLVEQRRRIGELLAELPPDAHHIAADMAALWPRLVHQLARRGALAAPSFTPSL